MVSGHGDALPRNEASWNTVGSIACNGLSTTEATDVHAAMQTKRFAVAWSKNHRVASTSAEPVLPDVRVSGAVKKIQRRDDNCQRGRQTRASGATNARGEATCARRLLNIFFFQRGFSKGRGVSTGSVR